MVNVLELLTRREGKTLEFKRDLSSSQNVLKTLVAFANTAGGVLLVGVDDGTRSIRGVADPILEEERLSNLVSDSIEPRLVPQIEGVFCENREIIAVEVHPSASRPHYLRSLGVERGVFVRVGSTNRQADQLLVAELRRSARSASFDEEPLSAFNSEAVDFRVASEFFRPVRELKPRDLEVLRLVVREQGRLVPSVGGMLLFGRNREEAFPDAWIQCGRFAGTDRQRIHDTVEVRDHLPAAAEQAISFVRKHAVRSADIGAVRRRDRTVWWSP